MNTPRIRLDVSARQWYLDRASVQRRIGKANAKALAKVGAAIRRTTRQNVLRRRKRVSRAGEPPSVHSRSSVATLRNVAFAYDPGSESLVVGPVLIGRKASPIGPAGDPVPGALEHGDRLTIREILTPAGVWVLATRANLARWASRPKRTRRATVEPRPFMGPSLERERDKIPEKWKGSV